jgi:hypothetical protein
MKNRESVRDIIDVGLVEVPEEVIAQFESEGRTRPASAVRPLWEGG